MFHLVADFLRSQGWADWKVAQIETDSLVWWIFRPGADTPDLVGKLPRTALDVEIARREASALASLSPFAGALNIPRLMFQTEAHDGRFLFVQSGISGSPLAEKTDSLEPVLAWLELFQSTITPQGTLAAAAVEAASRCGKELSDLQAEEIQLLSALEGAGTRLARHPATAVHGDFWTGNILQDGGRLAVVDWSNFHYGSPLEDLHNFAAAQGYESRSGAEEETLSMWRVFFGDTPLGQRTREATGRVLQGRGIPTELLQPLFLLFLARRIGCREFSNHAAWRRFVVRYVECGMPEPFGPR